VDDDAAGKIIEVPPGTRIADGIAIARPHPNAFELVRHEVERIIEVSDEAVEDAMRLYFRATHNVAEGAGAAALAAIRQEAAAVSGKRVAAVLTGGNVDSDVYCRVLSAGNKEDSSEGNVRTTIRRNQIDGVSPVSNPSAFGNCLKR